MQITKAILCVLWFWGHKMSSGQVHANVCTFCERCVSVCHTIVECIGMHFAKAFIMFPMLLSHSSLGLCLFIDSTIISLVCLYPSEPKLVNLSEPAKSIRLRVAVVA